MCSLVVQPYGTKAAPMADNFRLDEARGISQLHASIKQLADKADKQTRQMLWLTWAMAALTLVSSVLAGTQVWLALK